MISRLKGADTHFTRQLRDRAREAGAWKAKHNTKYQMCVNYDVISEDDSQRMSSVGPCGQIYEQKDTAFSAPRREQRSGSSEETPQNTGL